MNISKFKCKLAEYVEPTYSKTIRAQFKGREHQIPEKDQQDLARRKIKWTENTAAHQKKKDRCKKLQQTQKIQDLMDTLYRWTAGPGEFGNPTRRPLKWTGTMNIHYCQNWWVSDICLYMMYPFVSEDMYEVIFGLHTAIALLLVVPVNTQALREYRPTLLETLKNYRSAVPENWHGILVHELIHIFDYQIATGAPALATAMYIFERLVALFNRLINDRRDPEGNLANNLDQQTAVKNVMFSSLSPYNITEQLANVPPAIMKGLRFGHAEVENDSDDQKENPHQTKVPKRSRQASRDVVVSTLPTHSGFNLFTDNSIKTLTEIHTSMFINGLTRRSVHSEPPIGKAQFCRRYTISFP